MSRHMWHVRVVNSFAAFIGLVCACGCATIAQGTSDKIAVSTPLVDGATCELRNGSGVYRVTTPGEVNVPRSKTDLKVTCRKEGYQEATLTVQSSFGAAGGNLIAGGPIGVAVDAATGAGFEYPKVIQVLMAPTSTTSGGSGVSGPIM